MSSLNMNSEPPSAEISKSSLTKVLVPQSRSSFEEHPRLPAIRESRLNQKHIRHVSSRDFGKSQLYLPRVKTQKNYPNSSVNEQSAQSLGGGDSVETLQCCGNLRRLYLFNTSSSQLIQVPSECLEHSEESVSDDKVPGEILRLHEEDLEESKALKRWEYWMKDKERTQNYLSKRVGKKPWELMMQASDKYRGTLEKNFLISYSKIPEAETIKPQPRLKLIKNKRTGPPCTERKKFEPLPVPPVEFIGLSDVIKKEKGIALDSEIKKKKEDCKALSLKKILSHEIGMDKLVVVGVNPLNEKMQSQKSLSFENVPQIVEPDLHELKNLAIVEDERKSVFCLVINNSEIKYEIGNTPCQDFNRKYIWHVDFGTNLADSIAEKIMRIENRGTMAVRYDWLSTRNERKQYLGALQPKRYESWFFFNKNSGCFLPGQVYDMKFYFQPKTSGIQKEIWILRTHPPLSIRGGVAPIILSGVGTEEILSKTQPLQFHLYRRMRDTMIKYVTDLILHKVFDSYYTVCDIEYRSIFSEKELFEYHNPKHYYHSLIVKELKQIFQEISKNITQEWDMSLSSLCQVITTYKTGEERCSVLSKVAKKSIDLLRPRYSLVRDVQKYRMIYGILCKMTNFMEEDYQYLKSVVSQRIEASIDESDPGEAKEYTIGSCMRAAEMGEVSSIPLLEIKPINLMFFQALFYIKVYYRICEAVESIVGVLETRKLFQPWKTVNYKPPKPSRKGFNALK